MSGRRETNESPVWVLDMWRRRRDCFQMKLYTPIVKGITGGGVKGDI